MFSRVWVPLGAMALAISSSFFMCWCLWAPWPWPFPQVFSCIDSSVVHFLELSRLLVPRPIHFLEFSRVLVPRAVRFLEFSRVPVPFDTSDNGVCLLNCFRFAMPPTPLEAWRPCGKVNFRGGDLEKLRGG